MRKYSDITHSQDCWATTFVKLIEIFCFWSSISSQFVHKQKHSNCYQTEPRWGDWSQGVLVNLVHLCKDSIAFHHERTFSDVFVCHLDIIDKVYADIDGSWWKCQLYERVCLKWPAGQLEVLLCGGSSTFLAVLRSVLATLWLTKWPEWSPQCGGGGARRAAHWSCRPVPVSCSHCQHTTPTSLPPMVTQSCIIHTWNPRHTWTHSDHWGFGIEMTINF